MRKKLLALVFLVATFGGIYAAAAPAASASVVCVTARVNGNYVVPTTCVG